MVTKNKVPSPHQSRIDYFQSHCGGRICARYWHTDAGPPYALVFICHGVSEHSGVYEELGQKFAAKRILAFSHDHKGHGRSHGIRLMAASIDDYIPDILDHIKILRKTHDSIPLFIVAHSMGGMIAIRMMIKFPDVFQGVVLVGPAIIPGPQLGPFDLRQSLICSLPFKLVFGVLDWIDSEMPLGAFHPDMITRDKEAQEELKHDVLRYNFGPKVRILRTLIHGFSDNLSQLNQVNTPFLILHGDCDFLCNVRGSRLLLKESCSKDKALIEFEGATHNLYIETPDVRQLAFSRTVDWVLQRVPFKWNHHGQPLPE